MRDKIKIFTSDVDKTLIYENDNIQNELKDIILDFQIKSNNKLTLVTGRNFFLTKQIAKELEVKLPIITSNGSAIVDPTNQEIIYLNNIQIEKCIRVIKQFENDKVDITLYTEFEMLCLENSKWSSFLSEGSSKYNKNYHPIMYKFKNYNEIIEYLNTKDVLVTRILLDFPNVELAKDGDKKLNKNNLYSILYINKKESVIEIFNENTNKAIGIAKLLEILNIDSNQVAIFGDQINDIEMFEKFKYSFAVDNAIEVLKELAYQVIDSVYDFGVGKQLIKMLDNIEN